MRGIWLAVFLFASIIPISPKFVSAYHLEYPDVMGWLSITGTQISEPLVKGKDNSFYLKHNYKKQRASAGAAFADFRNLGQFYDSHMAIYGHYMKSGAMFHDLHYYKDFDFLIENMELYVSGLREAKTYKIVSVRIVDADDYYLILDLEDEAFWAYLKYLNQQSMHPIAMPSIEPVNSHQNYKLLTLVTCTYEFNNARLLVHAISED